MSAIYDENKASSEYVRNKNITNDPKQDTS